MNEQVLNAVRVLFHPCQVVHFQIAPIDPMASLNTMFLAAPDYQPNGNTNSHREGYEPVGGGEGEGEGEVGTTGCKRGDSDGETHVLYTLYTATVPWFIRLRCGMGEWNSAS